MAEGRHLPSMATSYFLYFALLGIFMPYLSPVLLDLGYSKSQIGALWGVMYFFSTVTPFAGGRISDRWLSADKTIRLCSALLLFSAVLLWWSPSNVWVFIPALLLFTLARSPLVSLQDTLAMEVAGDNPNKFSRLRMMGSVGFAVSVTLFGYLADWWGLRVFFVVQVILCLILLLSSKRLPEQGKAQKATEHKVFWGNLNRSWWMWIFAMVCHWISFGPFNYGFNLLLEEQNVAAHLHGWYWVIGIIMEVVVFMGSSWFFSRWHFRTLLFLAFFANLLRWLMLGLYPVPWLIALSQMLHGFGFALFYAAAMQGISHYCGGKNRASYQGLFSTCVGGFASIIGTSASGWLHDRMSWDAMILWFVPVQVLGIVILFLFPLTKVPDPE